MNARSAWLSPMNGYWARRKNASRARERRVLAPGRCRRPRTPPAASGAARASSPANRRAVQRAMAARSRAPARGRGRSRAPRRAAGRGPAPRAAAAGTAGPRAGRRPRTRPARAPAGAPPRSKSKAAAGTVSTRRPGMPGRVGSSSRPGRDGAAELERLLGASARSRGPPCSGVSVIARRTRRQRPPAAADDVERAARARRPSQGRRRRAARRPAGPAAAGSSSSMRADRQGADRQAAVGSVGPVGVDRREVDAAAAEVADDAVGLVEAVGDAHGGACAPPPRPRARRPARRRPARPRPGSSAPFVGPAHRLGGDVLDRVDAPWRRAMWANRRRALQRAVALGSGAEPPGGGQALGRARRATSR